mgnify:CR=1 FL=1
MHRPEPAKPARPAHPASASIAATALPPAPHRGTRNRRPQFPAATAAAMEALHILQQEPERIEHLWDVTKYALARFREEGFEIGETESPIIPLYVRDIEKTFIVTKLAFDAGVFINPVIPPACAPQDTLVRFALMANHTKEQVERGVIALKKVFVEQGIIK